MSTTRAQLATKAAASLERAELWRKTEQDVIELPLRLIERAQRLGRMLNDEYFAPTSKPRAQALMHPFGSHLTAFWCCVTHFAHMAELTETAHGWDTCFVYRGKETWEVFKVCVQTRCEHQWSKVATLELSGFATHTELCSAYAEHGGTVLRLDTAH